MLLRSNAARRLGFDLGQTFREALALGVDEGGGTRAGDRIDRAVERDVACERRAHHMLLDQLVVGETALVGVTIAFDEAGAFGDFEREVRRDGGGLDDESEPLFDRALLLLV